MNVENSFLIDPFLHREYYLFSQIVRALLSNKIVFCIDEKVNNSIGTKLCVNLINICTIFLKQTVHDTI